MPGLDCRLSDVPVMLRVCQYQAALWDETAAQGEDLGLKPGGYDQFQ
jgi:hypothetical protein